MSRNRRNQSEHNSLVLDHALRLENHGWNVQADLPNFDRPDPIGKDGRIPDVVATRGDRTKILEVETPRTLNSHQDQHSTFKRSVAQRENAEFELYVTRSGKS